MDDKKKIKELNDELYKYKLLYKVIKEDNENLKYNYRVLVDKYRFFEKVKRCFNFKNLGSKINKLFGRCKNEKKI